MIQMAVLQFAAARWNTDVAKKASAKSASIWFIQIQIQCISQIGMNRIAKMPTAIITEDLNRYMN